MSRNLDASSFLCALCLCAALLGRAGLVPSASSLLVRFYLAACSPPESLEQLLRCIARAMREPPGVLPKPARVLQYFSPSQESIKFHPR